MLELLEARAELRATVVKAVEVEVGPVLAMRWRRAIALFVEIRLSEEWTPGWALISELTPSQMAEVIDGARDEREAFAMVGYSAALVDAQHAQRRRAYLGGGR